MTTEPTSDTRHSFEDERVQLALLFAFAVLLLGLGIGLRDPWPSDEPRFALVAREMLASGHWLFPHRGIELYSDKPPMFMWLEACAYVITHGWRGWFLLPSLLAGLGTIALVYDFVRRQWSHHAALIAAAAVLVSFDFTYQMRAAQIDGVEVFWIMLAVYGLLRHLLLGPAWRWYAIGFLAAGLGVITKGVGVLALLVFLPFWFARGRGWNHVLPAQHWEPRWWLALLFFVPILGWALPMLWFTLHVHAGDAAYARYAHDILLGQTVSRYAEPAHHIHPWWSYVPVIVFEWLPLSLAIYWAIPGWIRHFRARDARTLLPLAWVVLVVIFFSASGGKRDVYILPALPVTALALAPLLPGILRSAPFRGALWGLTLLLALVLLTSGIGMHAGHLHKLTALATSALDGSPQPLIGMILGIGAAGVVIALAARPRHAAWGWCAFALVAWGTWGLVGYPLLNGYSSSRTVMERTASLVPRDDTIALVAWKEQNLLMLDVLGRNTVNFGYRLAWHDQLREALQWQAADPAHRWIFAYGKVLAPCVRIRDAIHAGHANRREWYLFNRSAVVPGCIPPRSDDAGQFGAYEPDDD
ncbi:MAG TPA: glycosyltransferase family 39 protein [Rhodanobacteraceae bacterium]|nr:glycosyltransferase family 39 protein [Rhodanobacteraceae bacterium]